MYIWIFLVPIAAKLLSQVNEVANVEIFGYKFEILLSLPFSWKAFYFSAIFFALATILHRLKGPRLIHDHPTYASFREEGKLDWHLRSYANDIDIDYDKFILDLEENMAEFDGGVHVGEKYSSSIFWHLYWIIDKSRSSYLSLTLIFYFCGFLFIGIVVIENFIWVAKPMMLAFLEVFGPLID